MGASRGGRPAKKSRMACLMAGMLGCGGGPKMSPGDKTPKRPQFRQNARENARTD